MKNISDISLCSLSFLFQFGLVLFWFVIIVRKISKVEHEGGEEKCDWESVSQVELQELAGKERPSIRMSTLGSEFDLKLEDEFSGKSLKIEEAILAATALPLSPTKREEFQQRTSDKWTSSRRVAFE